MAIKTITLSSGRDIIYNDDTKTIKFNPEVVVSKADMLEFSDEIPGNIEKLNFKDTSLGRDDVGDEGSIKLAGKLQAPIAEVDLSGTNLGPKAVQAFLAAEDRIPNLKVNGFTAEQRAAARLVIGPAPTIHDKFKAEMNHVALDVTELNLSKRGLDPQDADPLAEKLSQLTKLTKLSVAGNDFCNGCLNKISNALPDSTVSFDFSGNADKTDDRGLALMGPNIAKKPNLAEVKLDGLTKLTDAGIRNFVTGPLPPKLALISLKGINIGADGYAAIAEAKKTHPGLDIEVDHMDTLLAAEKHLAGGDQPLVPLPPVDPAAATAPAAPAQDPDEEKETSPPLDDPETPEASAPAVAENGPAQPAKSALPFGPAKPEIDLSEMKARVENGSILVGYHNKKLHQPGGRNDAKDVGQIQDALEMDVDGERGFCGPKTDAAIKKVQDLAGLKQDGAIGRLTIVAIQAYHNNGGDTNKEAAAQAAKDAVKAEVDDLMAHKGYGRPVTLKAIDASALPQVAADIKAQHK